MKSKVSKLVFYLCCVGSRAGAGGAGLGIVASQEIGLSNIQKISNKTMDFSESSLAEEQRNPEGETE